MWPQACFLKIFLTVFQFLSYSWLVFGIIFGVLGFIWLVMGSFTTMFTSLLTPPFWSNVWSVTLLEQQPMMSIHKELFTYFRFYCVSGLMCMYTIGLSIWFGTQKVCTWFCSCNFFCIFEKNYKWCSDLVVVIFLKK